MHGAALLDMRDVPAVLSDALPPDEQAAARIEMAAAIKPMPGDRRASRRGGTPGCVPAGLIDIKTSGM